MIGAPPQLLFAQLEFTHAIGPQPGAYLLAAGHLGAGGGELLDPDPVTGVRTPLASADTLLINVLPAPAARRAVALKRRARSAPSGAAPRAVSIALATLVKAATPLNATEAAAQLELCRQSEELQEELAAEALAVLNTAIRAHRAAAADPYVTELSRADPRAVRIGYGSGTAIADGRWHDAFECPPLRRSRLTRSERMRPALAVAGVVGGRLTLLDSDELLIRLLLDLDEGRPRAAAVQLRGALGLLLSEMGALAVPEDVHERLVRLAARIDDSDRLGREAQAGELPGSSVDTLADIVDEMLATVQAWRYETLEMTAKRQAGPPPVPECVGGR